MDPIQHLSSSLLNLGQIVENLAKIQQEQLSSSSNSGPHGTPHSHSSSAPRPPSFSGHASNNLSTWLFQMDSYFSLKGIHGLEKLDHLPPFLDRHALLWFQSVVTAIRNNLRPSFASWEAFVQELKIQFEPPNQQMLLRQQLRYLRQRSSIHDYVNRFRTIISQVLAMEEIDKISYFIEGLIPAAKKELFYRNPQSLESAIVIAFSFFSAGSTSSTFSTPHVPASNPTQMELGNVRSSSTRRNQKYFCEKCKSHGHTASYCRSGNSGTTASATKSSPSGPPYNQNKSHKLHLLDGNTEQSHTLVKAEAEARIHLNYSNGQKTDLLCLDGSILGNPARFLIDSGATHDYISTGFVEKFNIPLSADRSVTVTQADGTKHSASVTSACPIAIQNLRDSVVFRSFPLNNYDAILGRTWLYRHNPHINWRTNTLEITTPSDSYVLSKSLPIVTPGVSTDPLIVSHRVAVSSEELFLLSVLSDDTKPVPNVASTSPFNNLLQRYSDVFPPDLPSGVPNRAIEHSIELFDHTPINKASYRMSPIELTELKKQLDFLLDKGYIQPSFSPLASPVLFAKKANG